MNVRSIPAYQVWTTVLSHLLITAYYTFPRAAANAASSAAVWVVPLSCGAALLLMFPVVAAVAARPGRSFTDLGLEVGGRPLAVAAAVLISAFYVVSSGLSIRQAAEMVVTSLYPHTPQTFAMVGLAAAGTLGAAASVDGVLWGGSMFAWPAALSILVVLAGNFGSGQFRNLIPITGHGILPSLVHILPLTSYLDALLFVAILSRFTKEPAALKRGAAMAVGVALVLWTATVALFLMTFPLPGATGVPFPLFEMSRLIQGGRHFERIDSLWLIFWTFGSAGRMAGLLQACALLFQGAFRLPSYRMAVPALAIAAVAAALFPSNQAKAIAVETVNLRVWGFLVVLVLPCAVALAALWRRRRAAQGGSLRA